MLLLYKEKIKMIFFFGFVVPEVAVSPQNPEAQPIRTGSVVVDLL